MPAPSPAATVTRRTAPVPRSHVVTSDVAELVELTARLHRLALAGRLTALRAIVVVDGAVGEVAAGDVNAGCGAERISSL